MHSTWLQTTRSSEANTASSWWCRPALPQPVHSQKKPSTHHSSFESADWTLRTNNSRIRIIVIYRPLSSANYPASISTFINEFSSLLESVVICSESLIVTGDFNIHMDIQEESTQFTELLETFSLVQHVR